MGATLAYWTKAKRFADVLVRKTASGCRIRLLMLSRDSPGLADQISLTLAGASYEKFLVSIDEMAQFFARLVQREPKIEVRQIRHGTLYCTSARTDKSAIFAPRLYAERTHLQPAWIALSGSVLYDKIAGEFDGLWEANPAR